MSVLHKLEYDWPKKKKVKRSKRKPAHLHLNLMLFFLKKSLLEEIIFLIIQY